MQAQVLSLSAQSPASPPVVTPAAALSSAKQNVDLKQDHVDGKPEAKLLLSLCTNLKLWLDQTCYRKNVNRIAECDIFY